VLVVGEVLFHGGLREKAAPILARRRTARRDFRDADSMWFSPRVGAVFTGRASAPALSSWPLTGSVPMANTDDSAASAGRRLQPPHRETVRGDEQLTVHAVALADGRYG
jgi:hypothetical protein